MELKVYLHREAFSLLAVDPLKPFCIMKRRERPYWSPGKLIPTLVTSQTGKNLSTLKVQLDSLTSKHEGSSGVWCLQKFR